MENEITVDGFGISAGVIETIVGLAVADVDGVAGVGYADPLSGIRSKLSSSKNTPSGIEARATDEGELAVSVRLQVYYGYRIADVARAVREAVADAALSQLGTRIAAVDVYVDGVVFVDPE